MALILIIVGYLLGSLSSAIIVCKLKGLPDPRGEGSGNPGATNVLRISNKQTALLVLTGDALKGLIPVVIAQIVGVSGFSLALVGLAALLGHIFPVFFNFKGGRGVATALGVLLGLSIVAGILSAITWFAVAYLWRYSSLASLVATVLSPIYILIFSLSSYFVPVLLMAVLVVWRHWDNITRLRAGTESKIQF